MSLSQMRTPRSSGSPLTSRSHRSRRRRRRGAAATAGGRRGVRQPPSLPGPGGVRPGTVFSVGAAALLSLTVAGNAGAFTRVWDFLDFGAGVLALVSLSGAVLWGLIATDRLLLHSVHRLLAQGVHRGLAVSGLGFLVLHIWVKVARAQTSATAAAVPFTDTNQPLLIGLGTLAGYLFLTVAVTGAVRSAFASGKRSRYWRALHMSAYPAWGSALVHGLKSGRSAAGWVTVSYALCLAGVAVVLALRLRSRWSGTKRRPVAAVPAADWPVQRTREEPPVRVPANTAPQAEPRSYPPLGEPTAYVPLVEETTMSMPSMGDSTAYLPRVEDGAAYRPLVGDPSSVYAAPLAAEPTEQYGGQQYRSPVW